MQFSQVAERNERQQEQIATLFFHEITVSQNFVSRCAVLLPYAPHAQRHHLTAVENDGGCCASSFQARFRNSADGPVCEVLCADTRREQNELLRLSHRSLRDIGLTTHDVEQILRRPILHRCWRSVNLCEIQRCQNSIICMADCRLMPHLFH